MASINIDNIAKTVTIDGVSHVIDMSDFPQEISTVQYNTASRSGLISYSDTSREFTHIGATKFFSFGKYINRWKALNDPVVLSPAEIKAATIDQINAAREQTLAGGLNWNGKQWHTDTIFQAQITAYVSAYGTGLLEPTATVVIRAMDNTTNVLNRTQLFTLAGALMTFVGQAFAASWAAKDAL